MQKKFEFLYDAAHGWLKVTDGDLRQVGLTRDDFSAYSYCFGDTLYLEEDCDAYTFARAYRREFGTDPSVIELSDGIESPIRGLDRLSPSLNFDEIPF